MSRAGESELSDFIVNRTLRDIPGSRPREVLARRTNDSGTVLLTWEAPSKANGPIDFYQIRYSYRDFRDKDIVEDLNIRDRLADQSEHSV